MENRTPVIHSSGECFTTKLSRHKMEQVADTDSAVLSLEGSRFAIKLHLLKKYFNIFNPFLN